MVRSSPMTVRRLVMIAQLFHRWFSYGKALDRLWCPTRTSIDPTLTGSEPGLDGHNKFESDASLARNGFFLADSDNFSFNGLV